jgi:Mg2+ and Co2+ transporter CorA
MQPKATIDIEKLGTEYLTLVELLSDELARATAAIARNDLEALKKHIESQQNVCAQLLALVNSRPYLRANSPLSSVKDMLRTLIQNNRVYSALLATSGRSHQVILTLCKAYQESSCHGSERTQSARTLSCEV